MYAVDNGAGPIASAAGNRASEALMSTLARRVFPRLTVLVLAIALLTGALTIASGGAAASSRSVSAAVDVPDFGPNVKIFDPSMSTSEIKQTVDAIADQQVSS